MNKKQNRFITIALFLLIFTLIAIKCFVLNNILFDIDKFKVQVSPIDKCIPLNTQVGFDSNITEHDERYATYLVIKSLITPKLFAFKSNLDTVILVQNKKNKTKEISNYRVILTSEGPEIIISLITKIQK